MWDWRGERRLRKESRRRLDGSIASLAVFMVTTESKSDLIFVKVSIYNAAFQARTLCRK